MIWIVLYVILRYLTDNIAVYIFATYTALDQPLTPKKIIVPQNVNYC